MDRLVCGDVGFGKTEVALRAAFVAVHGRQAGGDPGADHAARRTALRRPSPTASPTGRCRSRSCRVSAPARKVTQALKGSAEGTVDIVIGTHKLLQHDVKFKNLGLVIIDEEHRFGVRQKEALESAARRGRCADADRDADSAHARHGARRPARFLGHRHRAAEAPGDQDFRRAAIATVVDPRSGAARIEARRPGLLPAQRSRDHRATARRMLARAAAGSAHRAWRTARCASASWRR